MALTPSKVREDFAILNKRQANGKPLVYLDNAATTQKPRQVVETIVNYYSTQNSNVGRGIYTLSTEAHDAYERARVSVQQFINARKPSEIIFTKGTTESINLVATSFGRQVLQAGDELIVSALEHHANLLPWQQICKERGAQLRIIPLNERGELDMEAFKALLSERTRLVAVAHVSNVLGTVLPLQDIIREAHARDVPVLVDGAQGIAHELVDVQQLDCDFYCFSGHKVYGPMGIGVLYGKEKWLEMMPPYQVGGGIVLNVTYEQALSYKELPFKHETGTPNVEGALGLATALQYISQLGREEICRYENELLEYATQRLQSIADLKIIGTARHKSGVVSFNREGYHPYDIGNHANTFGIALRTGVHCAIPLANLLGTVGTVRASFAFYNTREEIDLLCEVVASAPKGTWSLQKIGSRR